MNLYTLFQQRLDFTPENPVDSEAIRTRRLALSRPVIASEAPFEHLQARIKRTLLSFSLATLVLTVGYALLASPWWLLPIIPCALITLSLALGLRHQVKMRQLLQALRHEAKGLRPVSMGELAEIARLAKTTPELGRYADAVQQMNRPFVAADLYLMKRVECSNPPSSMNAGSAALY